MRGPLIKPLPQLVITPLEPAGREFPGVRHPDIEVWRDPQGEICGYGLAWEGGYVAHHPNLATYYLTHADLQVIACPQPGAAAGQVLETYLKDVLPLFLQLRGQEVLHAGGILTPPGVVALCAHSGIGKSTLAHALSHQGYGYWADDAVALEIADGCVLSLPLPFQVYLKPSAKAFFSEEASPPGATADEAQPACAAWSNPEPLAAVIELERCATAQGDEPVQVERLSPTEALLTALSHAYCFSLKDQERKGFMLRNYLTLAAAVPFFRLRFQPGFRYLPKIVQAVENLVAGLA